jgi:hypothetical protein
MRRSTVVVRVELEEDDDPEDDDPTVLGRRLTAFFSLACVFSSGLHLNR